MRQFIHFYFVMEAAGTWSLRARSSARSGSGNVGHKVRQRDYVFDSKQAALETACGLAQKNTPSEVILIDKELSHIQATFRSVEGR